MTTSTATPGRSIASEPGELLIRTAVRSGAADVDNAPSATPSARRTISRFGSYLLPWVVGAASFGAPIPPGLRRVFSAAETSRSEIGGVAWVLNEFAYSEEMATIEQVIALNALLGLPAVAGFSVELTD